jgi:hypothetical protein
MITKNKSFSAKFPVGSNCDDSSMTVFGLDILSRFWVESTHIQGKYNICMEVVAGSIKICIESREMPILGT